MTEDRKALWEKWTGVKQPHLAHPWLNYNRYFEANHIVDLLTKYGEDFTKLKVLDYGCGVSDYGITFGRLGSKVSIWDVDENAIEFAIFRFNEEGIGERVEKAKLEEDFNVAIFGEVLEHTDNPLEVLQTFVDDKTKYLFTSSYPYRSDDPNDPYWHHRGHRDHPETCALQKPCRELLEKYYTYERFEGEMRLWKRKELL